MTWKEWERFLKKEQKRIKSPHYTDIFEYSPRVSEFEDTVWSNYHSETRAVKKTIATFIASGDWPKKLSPAQRYWVWRRIDFALGFLNQIQVTTSGDHLPISSHPIETIRDEKMLDWFLERLWEARSNVYVGLHSMWEEYKKAIQRDAEFAAEFNKQFRIVSLIAKDTGPKTKKKGETNRVWHCIITLEDGTRHRGNFISSTEPTIPELQDVFRNHRNVFYKIPKSSPDEPNNEDLKK